LSLDAAYLVNSKGRIHRPPQKAKVLQQVNISDLPVVRAGLEGREGVYEYDVEGVALSALSLSYGNRLVGHCAAGQERGLSLLQEMQRFFVVALLSALFLRGILA